MISCALLGTTETESKELHSNLEKAKGAIEELKAIHSRTELLMKICNYKLERDIGAARTNYQKVVGKIFMVAKRNIDAALVELSKEAPISDFEEARSLSPEETKLLLQRSTKFYETFKLTEDRATEMWNLMLEVNSKNLDYFPNPLRLLVYQQSALCKGGEALSTQPFDETYTHRIYTYTEGEGITGIHSYYPGGSGPSPNVRLTLASILGNVPGICPTGLMLIGTTTHSNSMKVRN
jgi:hypothetical protein